MIGIEMEKNYCRDLVSTSPSCERCKSTTFFPSVKLIYLAYLNDISGILLYLVMPPEDFRSKPLRFLMQDILVEHLFIPLLNILSDPLFINRTIVWLVSFYIFGFCLLTTAFY